MTALAFPLITALTAAGLTVLYIKLAIAIVKLRRAHLISLGDGGREDLHYAVRAHGNFAEYVPIALIVVALAEMMGAWWPLVLANAVLLVAGRVFHAGMYQNAQHNLKARSRGMILTFAALAGGALLCAVMAALNLMSRF